MNKSLGRDKQILIRILEHQRELKSTMEFHKCKTEQQITTNKMCVDLCSFYMLNIYEEYKNLTEKSQLQLDFIESGILRELRNFIGHTYKTANKSLLAAYIVAFSSDKSIKKTVEQLKYCGDNARKGS